MPARPITLLAAAGLLVLCSASTVSGGNARRASDPCPRAALGSGYVSRVAAALRAREDVWGNALLEEPAGPTYAGARRYLKRLLLARAAKGARLTASGVHYVPFSGPVGARGAGSMALHVADGSQILSQRASGRSLTVKVGRAGDERFGSCLARLASPHLAGGYLPVLETRYVDADGVRYRQRSFATRVAETRSLVSFVELTAQAIDSSAATLRFTASDPGLVRRGTSLTRGDDTVLAFSAGGMVDGSSVSYEVPRGRTRTVYIAWLNAPAATLALTLDHATFESALSTLVRHWHGRLTEGSTISVPERPVQDAYRGILVQNLALTWRYSVGNPYQQFSYPEGVDVAQVLSTHGFSTVARAMLLTSLTTPLTRYPNWKMGQKLVGCALYYRLFRDRRFVEQVTPDLRAYVATLGRQIRSSNRGLLNRERFSSDIPDVVYGLHTQAVVWQGLRTMAAAWAATGHRTLSSETRRLAAELEKGLRTAIRASQQRLHDGSLFVPARLLAAETPYESVTESRSGAYWNLVAPYAFASGLFAPGSPEANGVIRYLLLHGSRLLGLVRAGAYSLYGLAPSYPTSGVNPVYGLNVARLLADNDRSDQLVLSLYGQLAAGMTRGTFVSGEGLSVSPLRREYFRSMYLPPNGASNASFLETLRLMLVHERRGRGLAPTGLDLAFATPRAWLEPGKRIVVQRAPTSFGPLTFSISSLEGEIRVSLVVPSGVRARAVRLRLRLPHGNGIARVTIGGRPHGRVDARSETIDLSGMTGRLEVVVRITKR